MKESQDAILDSVEKEYLAHIEREYRRAISSISTKIRSWYQRLAQNNDVTFAEARRLLTKNELKEFHWTVEEYMQHAWENSDGIWEKELENASARIHITRLDALKTQLQQQLQELTDKQITTVQNAATKAYLDSYYHTAFEVQSEAGVGIRMQGVDPARIETALKRPWTTDGKNFVARCWTDKNRLVNVLNRELTRMIATGENPDRAITNIAKEFNTSKRNAGRLVNTESSFAAAQAQKDTFKELKVERYMIVATLSGTTCEGCGDMDGLVFPMSEFKPGSTANPFHPNCRCTTKPYDEDVERFAKRIARDASTGERFEMPAGTTYADWKEMQDEKYGAGFVDTERKKAYNQNSDWKQFRDYQTVLQKEGPSDFGAFQNTKHGNPSSWKSLKKQKADTLEQMIHKDYSEISFMKGHMSNQKARQWYVNHVNRIHNIVDSDLPLEERAKKAFDLRNQYRFQARELMRDQARRRALDETDPILSFDELLENKMKRKGMTREEALEDIWKTATKTRKSTNERFGVDDD